MKKKTKEVAMRKVTITRKADEFSFLQGPNTIFMDGFMPNAEVVNTDDGVYYKITGFEKVSINELAEKYQVYSWYDHRTEIFFLKKFLPSMIGQGPKKIVGVEFFKVTRLGNEVLVKINNYYKTVYMSKLVVENEEGYMIINAVSGLRDAAIRNFSSLKETGSFPFTMGPKSDVLLKIKASAIKAGEVPLFNYKGKKMHISVDTPKALDYISKVFQPDETLQKVKVFVVAKASRIIPGVFEGGMIANKNSERISQKLKYKTAREDSYQTPEDVWHSSLNGILNKSSEVTMGISSLDVEYKYSVGEDGLMEITFRKRGFSNGDKISNLKGIISFTAEFPIEISGCELIAGPNSVKYQYNWDLINDNVKVRLGNIDVEGKIVEMDLYRSYWGEERSSLNKAGRGLAAIINSILLAGGNDKMLEFVANDMRMMLCSDADIIKVAAFKSLKNKTDEELRAALLELEEKVLELGKNKLFIPYGSLVYRDQETFEEEEEARGPTVFARKMIGIVNHPKFKDGIKYKNDLVRHYAKMMRAQFAPNGSPMKRVSSATNVTIAPLEGILEMDEIAVSLNIYDMLKKRANKEASLYRFPIIDFGNTVKVKVTPFDEEMVARIYTETGLEVEIPTCSNIYIAAELMSILQADHDGDTATIDFGMPGVAYSLARKLSHKFYKGEFKHLESIKKELNGYEPETVPFVFKDVVEISRKQGYAANRIGIETNNLRSTHFEEFVNMPENPECKDIEKTLDNLQELGALVEEKVIKYKSRKVLENISETMMRYSVEETEFLDGLDEEYKETLLFLLKGVLPVDDGKEIILIDIVNKIRKKVEAKSPSFLRRILLVMLPKI